MLAFFLLPSEGVSSLPGGKGIICHLLPIRDVGHPGPLYAGQGSGCFES